MWFGHEPGPPFNAAPRLIDIGAMGAPGDIDPYEVLGLNPRADDVVIRAAWKALIRKYHPDTSTASDAVERAAQINAAFKLLVTTEARAAYDRSQVRPVAPAPQSGPAPAWQSARPRGRPAPMPPRRRFRLHHKMIAATLAILMIGGLTFYLARNDISFPGSVQHIVDRVIADPSVTQARNKARSLLGLDAPAAFTAIAPPSSVETGPPPPIDTAAIVATVERLETLSGRSDGAAAGEGRNCAAKAQTAPSWAALDNCTALHIAGLAIAKGLFDAPDPDAAYFEQATLTLPERYAAISANNMLIDARIDTIRKTVLSTMLQKFEARFIARHASASLPIEQERLTPGPIVQSKLSVRPTISKP